MSKNGVWQLQRVAINYCQHSGSSKHIRNILPTQIVEFKEANPQIEFEEVVKSGSHPSFLATYASGKQKFVPLRGREEDKIIKHLQNLKDTTGNKPRKFGDRYITKTESIQGLWHPFLDLKNVNEQQQQQQQ
ncbi:hypothetical protein SAMD00019534_005080 [Acytostelium subglobosum LB1]|uniref:hypothetical protein n=1 Tax=Acytostelium subglobosum LB1 TaxID=1410327 RepID=UPI000644A43B|nr:hypothetical protein SAMD00019534_005080 [Acytostelium subglobosum LB1]GAM17333.1 hypothetical protein SAMD00019534_005080 [Acytostelium subglobosum LB1]|eukprot:XP_012759395.1 hypothetical protein SAMD00019534_005080 [Acytostelium subglobosum LB1]